MNNGKKKQFRRRRKIIKPRYQLKLSVFVVVFLLIYSLALGIAVFYPFAAEFGGSQTFEDQASLAAVFLRFHETAWLGLAVILILAFIGTILFSHRVAGPIYRLERVMEGFLKGNFEQTFRLRKNDEFREIETVVNGLARFLQRTKSEDAHFRSRLDEHVSRLTAVLEREGFSQSSEPRRILEELAAELRSRHHAFTTEERGEPECTTPA